MTKQEAQRQTQQENRLLEAGVSRADAEVLRRISRTLQRWFELECGTGEGQVSVSIERDGDAGDGKPFKRIQYPTAHGYVDTRYPVADRERGALRRLKAIMSKYPQLEAYVQGDPRGAALYVLTEAQRGDRAVDVGSIYNRGIVVC